MRASIFVVALLAALATVRIAAADGEVGLVVHWGDGTTSTACVGFTGDGISGDAVLAKAGYSVNQFSGLVCGIDDVGCQHSGTFNSCTCECQTGSDSCTYWSFFEQEYGGQWRYSALGLFVAKAEDGDLQAWNWGPGSPASAPAPPETTFEAVCGHAPMAMSTVPPSATPQPVSTVPGAGASVAATATTAPTQTSEDPASTTVTASPNATPTQVARGTPTEVAATTSRATDTPAPPATGGSADSSGAPWAAIGFAGVAGILVLGIVAALVTRSRRGN